MSTGHGTTKFTQVGTAPTSVRVTTLLTLASVVSLVILGTWVLKSELGSLETRFAVMNHRLLTIEYKLAIRYTDNSSLDIPSRGR